MPLHTNRNNNYTQHFYIFSIIFYEITQKEEQLETAKGKSVYAIRVIIKQVNWIQLTHHLMVIF